MCKYFICKIHFHLNELLENIDLDTLLLLIEVLNSIYETQHDNKHEQYPIDLILK